jgi:hypothetical protein
MALTVYGILALTFMMSMYALEHRGDGFILVVAVRRWWTRAHGATAS